MEYYLKDINEKTAMKLADFFILKRKELPHVFLLNGEVGTGKTTFSRAYITQGDMKLAFSSPTYTLVNEYNYNDVAIRHFDLYRITTDDYEWIYEYLDTADNKTILLFEWASLHQELFADYEHITIIFDYATSLTRNIKILLEDKYDKVMKEFFTNEGIVFEKCN